MRARLRSPLRRTLAGQAASMAAICCTLSGCAAAVATPPQPPLERRPPVVMFVGDSFTVGSGPVPRWHTYAAEAARLLGWQPVIAGAGGTGFVSDGRVGRTFQESFEAELAWRPAPDVLVISGGHNDGRWPAERVGEAADRLLDTARATWPKTQIVMVGPIWLDPTPPAKAYRVRDALARVASSQAVPFLDALRRPWSSGGGKAEVKAVLPDGVHPTRAGHALMGRWLARSLTRLPHQGP